MRSFRGVVDEAHLDLTLEASDSASLGTTGLELDYVSLFRSSVEACAEDKTWFNRYIIS
jgi:hypothetical protein